MKRLISFLLIPIFLLLSSCSVPQAQEQFFTMDTIMSITVYGKGAEEAAASARQKVEELNDQLSRTAADSLISQLNAHAGDGSDIQMDKDTLDLLSFAKSISQLLPGDFDITIAPVMDAWGFTTEDRHVPDDKTLSAAMALVNSENLIIDKDAGTARLSQPGMAVDLGSIAKGYAAAQAESVLRDAGITSALLDLGRNITAIGPKTDGTAWRVGVANPQDDSQYLCIISLEDQTASTSGGYERWFEENGVRYHHIIDPKTGYPAQSGLLSVTVISSNHLLADALSTALFVAGPEDAINFWRSRDDFELVLCTDQGQVMVTEGLEAGFEFRGEEQGYDCQIIRR